jgi:hypothetical protein
MLQLDLTAHEEIAAANGVTTTPTFLVCTPDGKRAFADDRTNRLVQTTIEKGASAGAFPGESGVMADPLKVGHTLLRVYANYALHGGMTPTNPTVVSALVDSLDAAGESDSGDGLLDAALASSRAAEERKHWLLILRGLRRRVCGKLSEGLADLARAVPALQFAEAGDGKPHSAITAPFAVRVGSEFLGTMPSTLDIATAARALSFASKQGAAPPQPAGAAREDLLGMLAFAITADKGALAGDTVTALGNASFLPPEEFNHAAFLVAVHLSRQSKDHAMVFAELKGVMDRCTAEPFYADTIALTLDVSRRQGDAEATRRNWDALLPYIGPRVPLRLRDRIPTADADSLLPPLP